MSSQSDSRRLQRIAEKNALAKKAEDAANAKMLTDIEKQRKEQAKAEAEASKTSEGSPAEGAATEEGAPGVEEKAPAAEDKSVADKTALGLKLTMPGAPATGPQHHYMFELYALNITIDVPPTDDAFETRAIVMGAMQTHILGKAVYGGLFRRPAQ